MKASLLMIALALPACATTTPIAEPHGPTVAAMQFCTRDGYVALREKKKNGFVVITMSNKRCGKPNPPPPTKEQTKEVQA